MWARIQPRDFADALSTLLLTAGEAARYLGVDRKMVYQLIEWGEIRAVKVGRAVRIDKESLD
jgi:excisionase family DNA binding protein